MLSSSNSKFCARLVTDLEIKDAYSSLANLSHPALMIIFLIFFVRAWEIIGNDFLKAVHEFFRT